MLIAVYLPPSSVSQDKRQQRLLLCDALMDQAVSVAFEWRGLAVIAGDFNHELHELSAWPFLASKGWKTCSLQVTNWLLVSPGLHPACNGAATLRDGRFPQHHPIFLDFRIEGALWKTQAFPIHFFVLIGTTPRRPAVAMVSINKPKRSLAASDPHVRMKASQRGRCGPVTLKSKPAPKGVKPGKVGDFEPCGEPFSVHVKQVTRQARRLQELHRILTRSGFVRDECSSVPLLKAICDAKGFGCSFQSWLSSVGGPVLIQDELSAENLQVTLQLTCDFATTSAKRETSLRQERFAEALKHSIRAGRQTCPPSDAPSGQPEVHAPLRWRHLRRRVKGSAISLDA